MGKTVNGATISEHLPKLAALAGMDIEQLYLWEFSRLSAVAAPPATCSPTSLTSPASERAQKLFRQQQLCPRLDLACDRSLEIGAGLTVVLGWPCSQPSTVGRALFATTDREVGFLTEEDLRPAWHSRLLHHFATQVKRVKLLRQVCLPPVMEDLLRNKWKSMKTQRTMSRLSMLGRIWATCR